jgi:hypothetical protein
MLYTDLALLPNLPQFLRLAKGYFSSGDTFHIFRKAQMELLIALLEKVISSSV